MKNTILKTIGTTVLAILTLTIFTQISVSAQDLKPDETAPELISKGLGARALEGSWNAMVTFRNCQTGAEIRPPFPAMNTFMQGGTLHEFGVGTAPLTRGPGHGTWEHIGGQSFSSVFQFFRFNADGTYAGYTKARRQIEVNDEGNAYSVVSATEIYNAAGILIATGCATETATRLE